MQKQNKQKAPEKITMKMIRSSFYDYQDLDIDHKSVIEADLSKQKYGYEPRPYYVDIKYKCKKCKVHFLFTAEEQKLWYESFGFWNRAYPIHCYHCRQIERKHKDLMKEFSIYEKQNDSNLSKEEALKLSEMILTLFEKPFSEQLTSRYNHLVRLANKEC